jgi:ferric-dicitrate binding protein FerR (iron transport regulator)
VLIDVERGSLRAMFGALAGGDAHERLVTTPSAVLAVRGTDYGIEVEKDGDTSVVVFEGTVEVSDLASGQSVLVPAGQASRIRVGRSPSSPQAHGLSADDWRRGQRSTPGAPSGGQQIQPMGSGSQGGSGQPKSSQGGSKRRGG